MSLTTDSSSPVSDGLFARARGGDQAAWDELFAACHDKVLRVVRRRLNPPMRSLYDSSDFVSEVWKSLAAKVDRLDFPTVDDLIAFLVQAVKQKIIDEHRRQHAQKRDIDLNRRLGDLEGEQAGPVDLPSPEPTPSQFAVAKETQERLLAGQTAPVQEVITRKVQGYTNEEVAAQTGLQVRKVQRVLKGLREALVGGGRR